MADILIGNVVGKLTADSTEFVRGIEAALQSLTRFQQALQHQGNALNQAMTPSLRAASQGFQQMGQAQQQATTAGSALTTSLQHVSQATQASTTHVQAFSAAWRNISQIAGGIGLATTIQGIAGAMSNFAQSAVETSARMESLRASLSALAGSTSAGRAQFDQLFATAQRLGVAFEPLVRGWRTLTAAATAANIPLAEQRRLLEAVTVEGRRVGSSNEELTRIFQALSQMASKGVVSMEELRGQLGEALPTALAAMARGMGVTTEELSKLVETGGVRAPAAFRALVRGLEETQRSGVVAGDTLRASWDRFSNELLKTKENLASLLPGLKAATDAATEFLTKVNNLAKARAELRQVLGEEGRQVAGVREPDVARLPAQQQQRLKEIADLIARQGETSPLGGRLEDLLPQTLRDKNIAALKEEQASILAGAAALREQRAGQEKITEEVNKTTAARERDADAVAALRKSLDDISKNAEAFRREAALAPALFGRPTGTPEEQTTFLKEAQQRLRPQAEALTTQMATMQRLGQVIPPEVFTEAQKAIGAMGEYGKALEQIKDKQEAATKAQREGAAAASKAQREALEDIRRRAREAEQEEREIQQEARARRREDIKDLDIFGLTLSPEQEADLKAQALAQKQRIQEWARTVDLFGLDLPPEVERARRIGEGFDMRVRQQLESVQTERFQRPEQRLRFAAEREGIELTPRREAQLKQLTAALEAQEALNQRIRVFGDLTNAIGSAWGQTLSSIADGTKTVSEAFRAMAQSILQSMAQIASQEAFRALTRLGLGLLTSGLTGSTVGMETPGGGIYQAPVGGGVPFLPPPIAFQHGGTVRSPTFAMLGENPATSPEHVLTRQQMAALTETTRSGGGQGGGGVTVHNIMVQSEAQAQQLKAQAEAMGEMAVVSVLRDMQKGESSRVIRTIRTLQR